MVQVATNDLIILFAFVPIVKFLLGVSNVSVPWDTLILSVVLFVVIPLAGGMLTRSFVIKKHGKDYFENTFVKKFDGITTIGLLLTLVMIFSFQGNVILENPLHIVLIAVPLILQTLLIFAIAYVAAYFLKLPHRCRTDFADIQNKKECGGNRQWQNHYLRTWAADTNGKANTFYPALPYHPKRNSR